MTTQTPAEIDAALGDVALKQLAFKSEPMRRISVAIVQCALRKRTMDEPLWPDEVDLSFIAQEHRNCIGTAWRMLTRVGVLSRSEHYRRSLNKTTRGRVIFAHYLKNHALAMTFLKRNNSPIPTFGQGELL